MSEEREQKEKCSNCMGRIWFQAAYLGQHYRPQKVRKKRRTAVQALRVMINAL